METVHLENSYVSVFESDIISTYTENGDKAYASSGDYNLDFFTKITRTATFDQYINSFINAWNECHQVAFQNLMNMRDVRNGKGEKLIPVAIMVYLKLSLDSDTYRVILENFVKYGCWKDVVRIYDIYCRYCKRNTINILNKIEIEIIADKLKTDSQSNDLVSLCAKWAPSENSHYDKSPTNAAKEIMTKMGLSPKNYRKMLSSLRKKINVLESNLSTQQYENINFSQIPSVAMMKSAPMFKRDCNSKNIVSEKRINLQTAYMKYLEGLKKGTEKVNTVGIQPHELIGKYMTNNAQLDDLTENQWLDIVNRVRTSGVFRDVTAIVDVSGSMNGQPMQVAIALGILLSDCTSGPFHGKVITFHTTPSWYILTGSTLMEKVNCLKKAPWGGSTNISAVFDLILSQAVSAQLTQDEMVKTLFIFTDMQFDSCDSKHKTSIELAKIKFNEKGYQLPRIVCWNLRSSITGTSPFCKNEDGYAMMSGFSAELLKYILTSNDFNPLAILSNTLKNYIVPDEITTCSSKLIYNPALNLENDIEKSKIKKSFVKNVKSTNDTLVVDLNTECEVFPDSDDWENPSDSCWIGLQTD